MSISKRPRSPSPPTSSSLSALGEDVHAISTSAKISDRKSHFLAVFSPTAPLAELRAHPSIAGASHRIAAWRRPGKQRSVLPGAPPPVETGWDDDGEAKAGRRVLGILESLDTQGTVVVGRWWGGVMLGPVRFTHIEQCAKGAIEAARGKMDGEQKRLKTQADEEKREKEQSERNAREKKRLVDVLPTRDAHITILRGLLAEKKQILSNTTPEQSPRSAPKVEYASMELTVLKRLENARDKTIAFVLGEIEKVEAKLEEAGKVETKDDTEADGKAAVMDTSKPTTTTEDHAASPTTPTKPNT